MLYKKIRNFKSPVELSQFKNRDIINGMSDIQFTTQILNKNLFDLLQSATIGCHIYWSSHQPIVSLCRHHFTGHQITSSSDTHGDEGGGCGGMWVDMHLSICNIQFIEGGSWYATCSTVICITLISAPSGSP